MIAEGILGPSDAGPSLLPPEWEQLEGDCPACSHTELGHHPVVTLHPSRILYVCYADVDGVHCYARNGACREEPLIR